MEYTDTTINQTSSTGISTTDVIIDKIYEQYAIFGVLIGHYYEIIYGYVIMYYSAFQKGLCDGTHLISSVTLNTFDSIMDSHYLKVFWEALRHNWHLSLMFDLCVVFTLMAVAERVKRRWFIKTRKTKGAESLQDLAKTAQDPENAEYLIRLIHENNYDVNYPFKGTGLTLFLCACLSGNKRAVTYMLNRCGADVRIVTNEYDSALYLATFGVLNSRKPNVSLLEELLEAGSNVNTQNTKGYTALHRAAAKGNIEVIELLLKHGADPNLQNYKGIFPIDSATHAGHIEAAELLRLDIRDDHVWDIVEPHTPPHIAMGLMTPRKDHLNESTLLPKSTKKERLAAVKPED